jgi:hypothetical protein
VGLRLQVGRQPILGRSFNHHNRCHSKEMKPRYFNPIYWFFRMMQGLANLAEQAIEDSRK